MGSTTAKRWLIEAKVAAATAAATGCGIAVAVLNDIEADHSMLGSTPPWLQALILVLAPPLVTGLAGWQTRHTPRPDLAESASTTPVTGA
ncbi:holin [Streptomyces sp. NPDC021224]|uniref:holin n=1 Tax=unclassified Streptomyces TaxID=2593676 RepID=UPI0037AEBDA4